MSISSTEEIQFYEYALFSAADVEAVGTLRTEVIEESLDDAELQKLVVAAEVCGASAWLDRYVEELSGCAHPAAQARALTLAGFRQPNNCSDRILSQDWGGGFLGVTAGAARESYQRASWAQHWLEQAASAVVVDLRFMALWRRLPASNVTRSYSADLHVRLKKAAMERLMKGRGALFGHRAPREDIASLIRGDVVAEHKPFMLHWLN
jgi:hypothetical protein